jgi:hypothetical protein
MKRRGFQTGCEEINDLRSGKTDHKQVFRLAVKRSLFFEVRDLKGFQAGCEEVIVLRSERPERFSGWL